MKNETFEEKLEHSKELLEIYNNYEGNYRIVLFLIQHPAFSEKIA